MNEVVFMILCFAVICQIITAHTITTNKRRERDQ